MPQAASVAAAEDIHEGLRRFPCHQLPAIDAGAAELVVGLRALIGLVFRVKA